jgi:hypothetical protein|tara:strand:+ start:146 stop:343 length:198 start_codon:yes stop_codon:yes gene_type:complete
MLIRKRSDLTGNTSTMNIEVTAEQLTSWRWGALIQKVMPNLTSEEREFIMTGITAPEWNSVFGGD